MEKIKQIFDFKHLESDIIHRIIAVVVAIVIWVVLSITQYPTTTLKISNIPVIFNMEGTIAEQEGLRAVGFQNITTTVEIKGMKYEIGGYTEKDLIATVNLDNVTKEGTYSLNIEAESVHTSDQCEILSCYPETIDVTFEHFGEQSFNVEAEAPNVTAEDDSFVAKTSVSPAKVVVTGSDENLKKIKRVAAITKEEKIISDDITISTSDLVFYDENDNLLGLGGKVLNQIRSIKIDNRLKELDECSFKIACDVNNPLYGENGAAYIYAPQKGATEEIVKELDRGLMNFAEVVKNDLGKDIANVAGVGAAGGLGFGFLAFLNSKLESGIKIILDEINLEEVIKDAEFILHVTPSKFTRETIKKYKEDNKSVSRLDKKRNKLNFLKSKKTLPLQNTAKSFNTNK